jgi:hypothetical protein
LYSLIKNVFAYLNVEASFSTGPVDFLILVSVLAVFFHTLKFESLTKIVTDILNYKNLSGNLRWLPNMNWNLPVESLFEKCWLSPPASVPPFSWGGGEV